MIVIILIHIKYHANVSILLNSLPSKPFKPATAQPLTNPAQDLILFKQAKF